MIAKVLLVLAGTLVVAAAPKGKMALAPVQYINMCYRDRVAEEC